MWKLNKERIGHIRTLTSDGRCYQCGFPQLKPEDRYWATHSLMGLIWYLQAPPGGNCVFCNRTWKLMSRLCRTLLNVYVLTCTSISAKRSTSYTGVVRQFSVPGLKPRMDLVQWTLAGIRPCIEQLLFLVFLTKPTYKIWPSWAMSTLPRNSCSK